MITPSSVRLTMARTHHLRASPFLASIRQPTSFNTFHSAARLAYPRAGSEDKDSINRESQEYAKGGTDDQVAALEDAAFNPDKTSPEEQKESAREENGGGPNPLDMSPANQEVSKPRDTDEGGAESSSSSSGSSQSERKRSSGKGSTPKNGGTS